MVTTHKLAFFSVKIELENYTFKNVNVKLHQRGFMFTFLFLGVVIARETPQAIQYVDRKLRAVVWYSLMWWRWMAVLQRRVWGDHPPSLLQCSASRIDLYVHRQTEVCLSIRLIYVLLLSAYGVALNFFPVSQFRFFPGHRQEFQTCAFVVVCSRFVSSEQLFTTPFIIFISKAKQNFPFFCCSFWKTSL